VRLGKWDVTHAEAPLFDDHNRSAFEESENLRQDKSKPVDHVAGGTVSESKNNCTDASAGRQRDNLAEVEIERDYDPILRRRFREDLSIREPMEILIAKVRRVVTCIRQPFSDAYVGTHIDEEARH
jgi:hypothetical protein